MNGQPLVKSTEQAPGARVERRRRAKLRWFRVRIETDGGAYTASLRLGAAGLRRLLDDERTYLALWNVVADGSARVEEFVALHKGTIVSVVVVGEERSPLSRERS
jgi:hypothetical protein